MLKTGQVRGIEDAHSNPAGVTPPSTHRHMIPHLFGDGCVSTTADVYIILLSHMVHIREIRFATCLRRSEGITQKIRCRQMPLTEV